MKLEFCKGTALDRQDILDFGDLVFSKNNCPHDFCSLVPKLYGDKSDFEKLHYIVKEDGKIRAMICVLPMEYKVGDITLKFNGVGTVSVHPISRSRGYMKKLMAWAIEDMQKNNDDFSALSGQRQRYEYFGYTPTGMRMSYHIDDTNLRHRYRNRDFANITLSVMTNEDAPTFFNMYQQQKNRVIRSQENFIDIISSWNAKPYSLYLNDEPVGYFSCTKSNIRELYLSKPELLPDVLYNIMNSLSLSSLEISLPFWDTVLTPELGRLSEDVTLCADHNYRIFNFEKVVEAFMKVKADYSCLPDGELCFTVEHSSFAVGVKNGKPYTKPIEGKETCINITSIEAARLFFSNEGWREINDFDGISLARAWFPLPLYVANPDDC